MKGDEFTTLLNKLRASDEESWLSIHSHMEIILRSWARKEKIELDWVVSGEVIGNTDSVVLEVYNRFRRDFMSGSLNITSYADYRKAVLSYCQEIMEDQYPRFHQLIAAGNDRAWQRVYERLYLYAAKWLSERLIEGEAGRVVYQESLLTLFEKVRSSELTFKTSREFKSYYFKILEFKSMEERRKMKLRSQRWTELDPDHMLRIIPKDPFEADDEFVRIEKIMRNSISKDEAFILKQYYFQRKKLSEIAKALSITNGNCRQKKLQALRKIATLCKKNKIPS